MAASQTENDGERHAATRGGRGVEARKNAGMDHIKNYIIFDANASEYETSMVTGDIKERLKGLRTTNP